MNHLRNLLSGLGLLTEAYTSPRGYNRDVGGFASDLKSMSEDARRVASGMRKNANKAAREAGHGEAYASQGAKR